MKKLFLIVLSLIACTFSMHAKTFKVNSIASLQNAINIAKPGDNIIVANGIYTTSESIVIKNSGTSVNKITIEAESIDSVEITGTNGFVIAPPSSYIIIKGFRFSHKTGTNTILAGATHCVITRNVFECVPVNTGRKDGLGASSITFSNNIIRGGEPVSIQGKYTDPVWSGNILWKTTGGDIPAEGYKIADPGFMQDKNGVFHSSLNHSTNSSGRYDTIQESNRPLTISDVGPGADK